MKSVRTLRLAVVTTLAAFAGCAAAADMPTQLVSADAQLVQRLDTKTATPGEAVTAKLTDKVKTADGWEIPKGAELIGRVSRVKASMNDGPSQMNIVFNEARLRSGKTIAIRAMVLGAYPPANYGDSGNTDAMDVQPHLIPADQRIDQEPGLLSHVSMKSNAEGKNSAVFASSDRNIDLRSGTQLQLAIAQVNGTTTMMKGAE
jgi:hypothetical protein